MGQKAQHKSWVSKIHSGVQSHLRQTAKDYGYIVADFVKWLADRPMNQGQFRPEIISTATVEMFLNRKHPVKDRITGEEKEEPYSIRYKNKMRAALSHFCSWLMDQGLLDKNPARQVDIPPKPMMAPRILTNDQRLVPLKQDIMFAQDTRIFET